MSIHPGYIPQTNQREAQFISRVYSTFQTVSLYKDLVLQATALSLIPEDELRSQAKLNYERQQEDESVKGKHTIDHFVMKELLHWFKHKFFKWVDQAPCEACGSGTKAVGRAEPNAYEKQGLAGVVEVYQCNSCNSYTRFPRYNHAGRLLETRRGRCGEWAQCFTLVCVAMGFESRFVSDWTDHVWTEVFIEGRWQHADSCEASLDAPLMYESGWGKKLNMIVAAGFDSIVDVTRRYTRKFYTEEFQSRRRQLGISEDFVQNALLNMNSQLQIFMEPVSVQVVKFKLDQEQEELRATQKQALVAKEEELKGRQSGSQEWVQSRGEGGTSQSKKRSLCAVPPSGVDTTRFEQNQKSAISLTTDKITLVGNAFTYAVNDQPAVCLTPNQTSQCGGMWLKEKHHISKHSLYAAFSFRVMGSGADGFAFVLQNQGPATLGEQGCGIGYQGISRSLAIEFDTYATVDRCNDPDGNHISIHTRYTQPNSAHHNHSIACTHNLEQDYGINLKDNKIHQVKVVYDAATKSMHVSVDELWILQNVSIDLAKVFGGEEDTCWIGFTASTGGLSEAHDILSFSLIQTDVPLPTEYVLHTSGNVVGIKKKIIEFNDAQQTSPLNGAALNTLTRIASQLETNEKNFAWTQQEHEIVFKILSSWDDSTHFPALDLLRVSIAKHPDVVGQYYTDGTSFLKQLLSRQKLQPFANRMLMYRLLANLFVSDKLRQVARASIEIILDSVAEEQANWAPQSLDKAPCREAYASLLYNFSALYYKNSKSLTDEERDLIVRLVSAGVSSLARELEESPLSDKSIYHLLQCIYLLLSIDEHASSEDHIAVGLVLSMDGDQLVNSVLQNAQIEQQTKDTARKLLSV